MNINILIKDLENEAVIIGFVNSNGECEYSNYILNNGGYIDTHSPNNIVNTLIEIFNVNDYEKYTLKEIL